MTKLFYRFNKNKFTNVQIQEQTDSFGKNKAYILFPHIIIAIYTHFLLVKINYYGFLRPNSRFSKLSAKQREGLKKKAVTCL